MNSADSTSTQKANIAAVVPPAKALSMIASFDRKPAKPM